MSGRKAGGAAFVPANGLIHTRRFEAAEYLHQGIAGKKSLALLVTRRAINTTATATKSGNSKKASLCRSPGNCFLEIHGLK